MNNLGCIYLKKDQFETSMEFLDESIDIYHGLLDDLVEKEKVNKDKAKSTSSTDSSNLKSIAFVAACRQYNKALSCQRFVLKIIQEYLPNHSMSNLVKKIPDDMAQMNNVETGLRSKAAVFIQKATLTWMNRVIKNNFIKQF